jgi:hypothetical protein
MSVDDYERARELIATHPERAHFAGPRDEALVRAAAETLGVEFPAVYRRFLLELGAGSFAGTEVYGVIDDDFRDSGVPDAIWRTLLLREEDGLPSDLVGIHEPGDGEQVCLRTGDGSIVSFSPGEDEQEFEVVSPDFGTWFREMIEDEVEVLEGRSSD